jgi:hypothetical protein
MRMAMSENTTLVMRRERRGEMPVTSRHWEEASAHGVDEVLKVCEIDGRLHIAERSSGRANGTRRSSSTTRIGPVQPMEDMVEE